jgi:hypothetical protein
MTLFTDNFPTATTDEDLDNLVRQYPNYDRYYIVSGSVPERKIRFEKLWRAYEPFADSHFLSQVKVDFHQRTWEMYLAGVLIKNFFKINSEDKGADIKVEIPDQFPLWVEAVAPKKGVGNDKVPDLAYGVVLDVPEEEMLIRLANSLQYKKSVYESYIQRGLVKKEEPFVIALNAAGLEHNSAPGIPLILKCLFALGYLTLPLNKNSDIPGRFGKPYWSRREAMQKVNGSPVPMDFFERKENAGISAVIYSKQNVLNHPEVLGADCVLVHNPLATNPINEKLFPFFEQWKKTDTQIIKLER